MNKLPRTPLPLTIGVITNEWISNGLPSALPTTACSLYAHFLSSKMALNSAQSASPAALSVVAMKTSSTFFPARHKPTSSFGGFTRFRKIWDMPRAPLLHTPKCRIIISSEMLANNLPASLVPCVNLATLAHMPSGVLLSQ